MTPTLIAAALGALVGRALHRSARHHYDSNRLQGHPIPVWGAILLALIEVPGRALVVLTEICVDIPTQIALRFHRARMAKVRAYEETRRQQEEDERQDAMLRHPSNYARRQAAIAAHPASYHARQRAGRPVAPGAVIPFPGAS